MASPINQNSPKQTKTTIDFDRTTPSLAAQAIANNDDLLIEILVRLPIKSLLKFKSVSKHWLFLISTPNFNLRRTPFPHTAAGLLAVGFIDHKHSYLTFISLVGEHCTNPLNSLSFLEKQRGCVLQSTNGLVLIRTPRGSFYHRIKHSEMEFFIANPTTKQYTLLPRPPACTGPTEIEFAYSLAFDPSKSLHYKVVCVYQSSEQNYQIEVYSSESRCWKPPCGSVGAPFNVRSFDHGSCGGVYWNGAVNWIISRRRSLLYFNLEKEELHEISLPHNSERSYVAYFGESRDHLHLVDMISRKTKFDVYEMERDYSTWFVKFRVDLDEVAAAYPMRNIDATRFSFTIMSVVRCDVEEESYMVLNTQHKVILYYFKTNTFKMLLNTGLRGYRSNSHQYIESFASI